jgi:hypothetical protein
MFDELSLSMRFSNRFPVSMKVATFASATSLLLSTAAEILPRILPLRPEAVDE